MISFENGRGSKQGVHGGNKKYLGTRRPLSRGIFFATRLLQKKVWRKRGSNPRPTGFETQKKIKHQPGFEPTTYWLGKQ